MGWGMGIPIGWPNNPHSVPNLTAYIPASPSLDLFKNFTIEWFAKGPVPNENSPIEVFWSFGSDIDFHSAFLENLGSPSSTDWRFCYSINGVPIIYVDVDAEINSGNFNFFVIERYINKIYFGLNGTWVETTTFNEDPISSGNKPLYIGSDGLFNNLTNGLINNFRWSVEAAIYDVGANFSVPETNLEVLPENVFLVCGQAYNFPDLLLDKTENGHNIINSTGTFFNGNPFGFNLQGSLRFA